MDDFDKDAHDMYLASKGQPPTEEIVTIKNKETGTKFTGGLHQYSEDYDPRTGDGVIRIHLKDENAIIECGASTWFIVEKED